MSDVQPKFFYGLLCFGLAGNSERMPWCVRHSQELAESSAQIDTESDTSRKQMKRSVYAVWNIETGEIVSLVHCGKVYAVLDETETQS